jgi:hypothetical protein
MVEVTLLKNRRDPYSRAGNNGDLHFQLPSEADETKSAASTLFPNIVSIAPSQNRDVVVRAQAGA